LPWDGDHPVRLAWAVCYEQPASLSQRLRRDFDVPSEIVAPLERLINASLAREQSDRPASAAEFRHEIQTLRRMLGLANDIEFDAPIWDVAEKLVLLGPPELSLSLPPSRELFFAYAAEDALARMIEDPRRRLIIDCDAIGHEQVLDVLDVLRSWKRDDSVTLICDDREWNAHYVIRGVRVLPHGAIHQIHDDVLAA
jgi:hypothetical protein